MRLQGKALLFCGILALAAHVTLLKMRQEPEAPISRSPRSALVDPEPPEADASVSAPDLQMGGNRPLDPFPADPLAATAAFADALLKSSVEDFAVWFGRLAVLPTSQHRRILTTHLLRRWGRLDHSSALAAVSAQPGITSTERTAFITHVHEGWAIGDPEGAWDAVLRRRAEMPPGSGVNGRAGPGGDGRIRAVLWALVEAGLHEQAADLISNAPPEAGALGASTTLVAAIWARTDPDRARKWIETLAGGPRNDAVAGFARTLVDMNSDAARQYFAEATLSDAQKAGQAILEGMVKRGERKAAGQWLRDSAVADSRLDAALISWFQNPGNRGILDGDSELTLLGKLTTLRDLTVFNYIAQTQDIDPKQALAAAVGYSSPGQLKANALKIIRSWAARDPAAAAAGIAQSSNLVPELRDELLRAVRDR